MTRISLCICWVPPRADPDGISVIQKIKDHGRMTQSAAINNVANVTGYYDNNSTGTGRVCGSCNQWYWGDVHTCYFYPYTYDWSPRQDPLVELKNLYRRAILQNLRKLVEDTYVTNHNLTKEQLLTKILDSIDYRIENELL